LALTRAEFARLVEDHGEALYRMAYRLVGDPHEAEDMVQDAFRSAWTSRERYAPGTTGRAWLAKILQRRVADHWRKPRLRVVGGDDAAEVGVEAADPLAQQYTDEMQYALSRLPTELRETLLLVVVAELTHQEAADVLGTPLGTVLSRVSRARIQLREHLMRYSKRG
jgi:RNA polymerase sigma-70 factor (ECF subfamily)